MAVLRIERGKERGRVIPIQRGKPVVVGREQRNELCVKDHMASRRHFEVAAGDGKRVFVKDLRSSNGTFLNGRRLAPDVATPLEVEDRVQAGGTLFALLSDAAGASEGKEGELTGKTIAGYRVCERIGRGGMGTVYKALQLSLERDVAFKVLARDLALDPSRVERFEREARAAGKLNHPNIVQVYSVGEEEGLHFYSMEFMERGSLEELLEREGKLLVPRAIQIAIDAAKGLEYAERARIVHRDVKPGNLMVNAEGVCKIGDLGIARAHEVGSTTAGARAIDDDAEGAPPSGAVTPTEEALDEAEDELVTGSPLYMAPEQAESPEVDHRADLYALGATLHHLLAGEPPFTAPSPREVIAKHRAEPPRRLDEIDPSIPADVADVVVRLLAKRREDRTASASALLAALRRLAARYPEGWKPGDPPAVADSGETEALAGKAPLPRAVALALAAAAAVLVLVLAGFYVKGRMDLAEQDRLAEEKRVKDEEDRRKALARAEDEARARALEKKREEDAEKERAAADLWLAGHASDLEGARERYEAVAKKFPGTAASKRAEEQAASIAGGIEEIASAKKGRAEREALAEADAKPFIEAARTGPLSGAQAVRRKLSDLETRWKGTEVGDKAVPAAKRALAERVDALQRQAQKAFDDALAKDDLAAAAAAIDAVERAQVEDLRSFCAERRKALAAAERAKNAFAEAAKAKERAQELEALDRIADRPRRLRWEFEDLAADVKAKDRTWKTDAAKERSALYARTFDAQAAFKKRLQEHVNGGKRPTLTYPVTKGIDGTAVKADDTGITFSARSGGGAIELTRAYDRFEEGELPRLLIVVPGLAPLERCGLAAVLDDLGEKDKASRELERAEKDAEKAGDEPARALAQALQAGAGGSK